MNDKREVPIDNCSKGILLNISMGGVEIGLPAATQKSEFREDQLIGLEFTPSQKSIVLDGMIKTIRPTADAENVCFGVQFVGLEANPEVSKALQEFCDSTERYFQTAESVTA